MRVYKSAYDCQLGLNNQNKAQLKTKAMGETVALEETVVLGNEIRTRDSFGKEEKKKKKKNTTK